MSRMKHLLRKLHIGGGGGGGGGGHVSDHEVCLPDPPPSASSSSSSSSTATAGPLSSPSGSTPSDTVESTTAGSGSRCETPREGFSFFEEEYQVQLAMALSASDPDGLEDPESMQMQAATRMSLGCSVPDESGGRGGGRSGGGGGIDHLSLRYWNYNVIDYDEKLMDGFYDVYGIALNSNLLQEMPSLEVLQATSVADGINYEVVIVNRAIDQTLQQLERRAMSIALESRAAEVGPMASGLVQKIADLVVDNMGGPVGNADDILGRWTLMIYELRTSLNTIVLPLGSLKVGLSRHRALLFKVLADRINLPCRLLKGSYCTGTDEGAVNLIKMDYNSEYIIDLMGAPGTLIPAEKPSGKLQNSGSNLLSFNPIGQTVKDLCFSFDMVCQFEKKSEISEESSSDSNMVAGIIDLQSEEKSRFGSPPEGDTGIIDLQSEEKSRVSSPPEGNDVSTTRENQKERSEHEFVEVLPMGRPQAAMFRNKEVASPSQQMKVDDVSKYVVNAAKNPEFAQKLHAVLLASGASPPPDLFSNLNPSQDSVEQRNIGKHLWMEGRKEEKEGQSPQDDLSLHLQPFYVPFTEAQSSSGANASNEEQIFADGMIHKLGANANPNKGPIGAGIPSPFATSEGLASLVTSANEISLANSMSKGSDIVPGTVVASRAPDRKQITDSRQRQIVSSPKAFGAHSSQENAGVVANIDTKELLLLKDCRESAKDSMVKCIGMGDSDLHILSGANNDRINPILADVAEWEIPWEDLHFGERIGIGSYGEVYRAEWNGTEVAVKKFLDQGLSGDALEQFRCEVKMMLRLRHPNVVLFMGAVTRPPNLSILTEFLPRGSLYKLLHRTNVQLDEKRRLKMALDVARGMNYLHTSHPTIVHRDLKSPNLLVDKNWVVKVCDFGLSRLKHHTFLSSKSTAGTPEWMAPEVLRNEPSNEKSDVYSFGVIMWELATLRIPWTGLNPMQVVGAVGFQNKHLEIPKEINPMAAKLINDCWESDPNERPSFTQLMSPLKQLRRLVAAAVVD